MVASLVLWTISLAWGQALINSNWQPSIRDAVIDIFFQLELLSLGYLVAYLFRRPVVGLLVLIPLFFIVSVGFTGSIELAQVGITSRLPNIVIAAAACLLLILLGLLQYALARRRLTRPEGAKVMYGSESPSTSRYYRPPSLGLQARPSQGTTLLWQQFRQTAPIAGALVLGSIFMMFMFALYSPLEERGRARGLLAVFAACSPLVIGLSASWLGAITFYGDNQDRRYAFFADRGISPTKVWWTRLVPPLISCLVMVAMLLAITAIVNLSQPEHRPSVWFATWFLVAMILVLFSFGQLISQWIEQPLLAFLAAPAYTFACLIPTFYFADNNSSLLLLIFLMPPVLFFASWQLSKQWLEGKNKIIYGLQILGYTLAASILPLLFVGLTMLYQFSVRHL